MSLFRLPKLRRIASSVGNLRNRFASRHDAVSVTERSFRRLLVDPLEERQLLSVSPSTAIDQLVNQSFVGDIGDNYEVYDIQTLTARSVAVDDDGDFVVTWTRYDYVIDPDTGAYEEDPRTGYLVTDANIYARYFTDEVQRITLPSELADDNIAGKYGKFSLTVGGPEIQKITISSWAEPYNDQMMYSSISGSFSVGFDVNGNGSIGAGEQFTMVYDEYDTENNEAMMQAGLRGLGGALADVVVECPSPQEFNIYFGDHSDGLDQPEIFIDPSLTNWDTGFLPSAVVTTVREPVTIEDIRVHPTDPFATAERIEQMFLYTTEDHYQGPTDFPTEEEVYGDTGENSYDYEAYTEPDTVRYADYQVSVTPALEVDPNDPTSYVYSRTSFIVTFVEESGKTNVPEMIVSEAVNDLGVSFITSTEIDVTTLKEPSDEFRVNDPEPDSDYYPVWATRTSQTNPTVAMDNDGDFVITWASEVSEVSSDTSISDIYARRFSPTSYVEDPEFVMEDGTGIHCVAPHGNAFQVNTVETDAQGQPAIAMDQDGNFIIVWATTAQDLSYFNQISGQRYNRDGDRIGNEFIASNTGGTNTITNVHYEPFVSISNDGFVLVTWSETSDPDVLSDDYFDPTGTAVDVWARLMTPDLSSSMVWVAGGGGNSTSAWDSKGGFLIGYDLLQDVDHIPTMMGASQGCYVTMYDLVTDQNGTGLYQIRQEFRANSATLNPAAQTLWSGDQWGSQVMIDADGDITVTYEGFGADSSEYIDMWGDYFADLINDEKNADLQTYFDPLWGSISPIYANTEFDDDVGDIDSEIEYVLAQAYTMGATDEQVGRLAAILNEAAGLLRGEGAGVFFSSFDATANSEPNELSGDCVVNADRDGNNARYIIQIDGRAVTGGFTVDLSHDQSGRTIRGIPVTPVYGKDGDVVFLDADKTTRNIALILEAALASLSPDGSLPSWPESNNPYEFYEGTVSVRRIDGTIDFQNREGTPFGWQQDQDFYYVYEVVFQGDAHDQYMSLGLNNNAMRRVDPADDKKTIKADSPVISAYNYGIDGEWQTEVSAGMQPDGDFVVAWAQYDEGTSGSTVATNVYFREFDEASDDAGPNVTDFMLDGGQRLTDGGQVIDNMEYIVVTFDEELLLEGTHGVTNLANWSLIQDDIQLSGGIRNIEFGMNMSSMLGLNDLGSNKWEAVIFFDGNGATSGTTPLEGGNYEIIASSAIRDVAGNALGRTGYELQGASVSRSFYLMPPTGTETRVNTQTPGDQIHDAGATGDPDLLPNSPQSIAGDADGERVVVWTSEDPSSAGVWAKVYRTTWTESSGDRVSTTAVVKEFRITDNPMATYASVARDGDGDFIVTWSQDDGTDINDPNSIPDWNVYCQRFDAMGRPLDAAPLMVNVETEGTQRYSSVAMDNDGDFVIVWQGEAQDDASQNENQDDSGYGIYAQQYSRSGKVLGGIDEIQIVRITGDITTATFTLDYDGQITGQVIYNGDLEATAGQLKAELAQLGITAEIDILNETDLAVRFTDEYGHRDVPPLVVNHSVIAGNGEVKVIMGVEGVSSEFLVNDFTDGNQVSPSVAMDATGNYVVSWTSFGQDDDDPNESNIYAKYYTNDHIITEDAEPLVEFLVNENPVDEDPNDGFVDTSMTDGDQKWSSVAMDLDGDYVISWTSYGQDGTGNGPGAGFLGENGVFARRFNVGNIPAADGFQVNTYEDSNQQRSRIAMDAAGNFVIVWESYQDRSSTGPDTGTSYGIYAQRYIATDRIVDDSNGQLGNEIHINTTNDGEQRYPSAMMSHAGDIIVTWTGEGSGDDVGIFMQKYEVQSDEAGPVVTDVATVLTDSSGIATGETKSIIDVELIDYPVGQFVVTFGENLSTKYTTSGPTSILNTNNWMLTCNGEAITDGVRTVEYGFNKAYMLGLADKPSGKYEGVVTLDGDPDTAGIQALGNGTYHLTVLDSVTDLFGNPLDGNLDGEPGGDFTQAFVIGTGGSQDNPVSSIVTSSRTHAESADAVAVDGDGDYVVAFTVYDAGIGTERVAIQLFYANGTSRGNTIFVTPGTELDFAGDTQTAASVAIDADGDIVVTWTNYDVVGGNADIYARMYNANGNAVSEAFRINQYTEDNQMWSSVAMDTDGDFVVTWSSYGQENSTSAGDRYGIYARRYDRFGDALGSEFQVNTTTAGNQQLSSVAMGADGRFVIVWQSDQDGVGDDIIVREYEADGSVRESTLVGEELVNDTTDGNQTYPDVAMNLDGSSYVVTWTSTQKTEDASGSAVYAKTYDFLDEDELNRNYSYEGDPVEIPDNGTIEIEIEVPDSFVINDLNVGLNIDHDDPSDLTIWVRPSWGDDDGSDDILLFSNVPREGDQNGVGEPGTPNGANFHQTIMDDEAGDSILDGLPPFDETYSPEEPLSKVDGRGTVFEENGIWKLIIQDQNPPNDPDNDTVVVDGTTTYPDTADGGIFRGATLYFDRSAASMEETLVNTTTMGNQTYSSVDMDSEGGFVVAWCGYGNQSDEEDTSRYGVFAQRFNITVVEEAIQYSKDESGETRINQTTDGMQWLPSVGMDAEGHYVTVWTGENEASGLYEVFHASSLDVVDDSMGPIVADVFSSMNGVLDPLCEDGTVVVGLEQLVVSFDEKLSTEQTLVNGAMVHDVGSILNLDNWLLQRNGVEVLDGIVDISFSRVSGRWQATITFDGNGISDGTTGLGAGDYTLAILDMVTDVAGNPLDGDRDGFAGTKPSTTGYSGFSFHFSVPGANYASGKESRVNADESDSTRDRELTKGIQQFSEARGTGYAREITTSSVATDDDGDYVVVWTNYDENDNADIYARFYCKDGTRSDVFLVNSVTAGTQNNAAVAMDADGEFMIVWESFDDGDGLNGYDVYAKMFSVTRTDTSVEINTVSVDANDRIKEDPYSGDYEFLVNTTTVGEQFNPAVDMDSYGNYVIVWGTSGQNFSYFNNVMAQRYNWRGEMLGDEFQVNVDDIPGANGPEFTGTFAVNPSVAMSDDGNVVVTWDRATTQTSGAVTNSEVVARIFDAENNPFIDPETAEDDEPTAMPEFVVNVGEFTSPDDTHIVLNEASGGDDFKRNARNPAIGMDSAGNFTIVYEAYQDNDEGDDDTPNSYGIYYRQFDAEGIPLTEHAQQANTVVTGDVDLGDDEQSTNYFDGDQVNPTIAMDADGDFAIFWNGNGGEPDRYDPRNPDLVGDQDEAGVFGRWFHAGTAGTLSEPTSTQQRVNVTEGGVQQFAAATMTPDGSTIVVWQGNGVGDRNGIFTRVYDSESDSAGPIATELLKSNGTRVGAGDNIYGNPNTLLVVFNEEVNALSKTADHSVENVNNWALFNGKGEEVAGGINNVEFYFNASLNKWVAEVYFSDNTGSAGALTNGSYTLVVSTDVQDVVGNALGRTGFDPYGVGRTYDETDDMQELEEVIEGYAFQFNVNNTYPGNPTDDSVDQIISTTSIIYGDDDLGQAGYQEESDVARNDNGDYVVVWVDYVEVISTINMEYEVPEGEELPVIPPEPAIQAKVRAQCFDNDGRATSDVIEVGMAIVGDQFDPAVAIDGNGNFIVVWANYLDLDGDPLTGYEEVDVYGQRFDKDGDLLGSSFRVNEYTASMQDEPAVAMNANTGEFVVTWSSFKQDGNLDGVYARRFRSTGQAYGDEQRVNTTTVGAQGESDIAMSATGEYVITWTSEQESSGTGIYAQRYNAVGGKLGGEIHVNTFTNGFQLDPAVAMDLLGNFVVVWTSPQDGSGTGIYAQRFNAAGARQGGEFRVNETTLHDQTEPDVSMSANGEFVVVWSSFNQDTTPPNEYIRDLGIYARTFNANGTDYDHAVVGVVGEFRINAETEGNQYAPAVSMDSFGHYVTTWTGLESLLTTYAENTDTESEEEFIAIDLPLTAIYSRFIDPPVEEEAVAVTPVDVILSGTSGDDHFEFVGGFSPNTWIVRINGILQTMPESVASLRFDGKGGNDTVTFTGSSANDTAEFWADHGSFTSYAYNVVVENVEAINATGGGGDDMAILHGTDGNDTFIGQAEESEMSGDGYSLVATSFETVQALAEGGDLDIASLFDSAGDDTYTSTPNSANMAGTGYIVQADGFDQTKGYAYGTGIDVADLYDSVENDTLTTGPTYAKLRNDHGYYTLATGFDSVRTYSTAGGYDQANMYGSEGDETFTAGPTYAKFQGDGFYHAANYFEAVNANGKGGNDTASLFDSDGDDTFVAGPHYGQMFGEGYQNRADFFRWVYGYGNGGGNDLASIYDSTNDDHLYVGQGYAQLYGGNFFNRAFGFDRVDARATTGGYDTATLDDSDLNDYLEAEGDWVRLSNDEIAFWAASFDHVTATSNNQGDTKKIAEIDFVLATEGFWTEE